MIQRIQSIFLALVAILMTGTIFFPFWQKQVQENQEVAQLNSISLEIQRAGEQVSQLNTIYIGIMAFLAVCLAFAAIFTYRNRMLQMKICLFNTVLMAATMGLILYFVEQGDSLIGGEGSPSSFGIGFYLPVGALFFNALANRFIRRDENMVRDSDRLR